MWVEILSLFSLCSIWHCHPLREDVSWNSRKPKKTVREWRHPLREDVSWNKFLCTKFLDSSKSSSSWGCELKYFYIPKRNDRLQVILFVRMWVEIVNRSSLMTNGWASSSSWGCELKFSYTFDIFGSVSVILFVRMWVEMIMLEPAGFGDPVILFVRMWVEIFVLLLSLLNKLVILFVRMWVEM